MRSKIGNGMMEEHMLLEQLGRKLIRSFDSRYPGFTVQRRVECLRAAIIDDPTLTGTLVAAAMPYVADTAKYYG
jgi:hypothetical protein